MSVSVLTYMCLLPQMSVSSESNEDVAARELYGADLEQDMAGMKLDKPVENACVATLAKFGPRLQLHPRRGD